MPHADRKPLFVCHTLYHAYVAAVLAVDARTCGRDPILVTAFTRNDVDPEFVGRLDALAWLDVVDATDRAAFRRISRLPAAAKLGLNMFLDRLYPRLAPRVHRLPALQDRQLFLFNDFHYLDRYLLRRAYGDAVLVEDGAMTYQPVRPRLKTRLKSLIGIPPSFGRHPKIAAIWVNRPDDLPADTRPKGAPLDLRARITGLAPDVRDRLVEAFLPDRPARLPANAAILMTQPLADFGRLTHAQHCRLYTTIAQRLADKGYEVWLKPHPSDSIGYAELGLPARLLPAAFPIEILNDVQDRPIALAIGVNTSAVRNVAFARHCTTLLPEDVWINEGTAGHLRSIEDTLDRMPPLDRATTGDALTS